MTALPVRAHGSSEQRGGFEPAGIPADVILQDALSGFFGGFEQAEEAARAAYRALTVDYRRVVVDAEHAAYDEDELRRLRARASSERVAVSAAAGEAGRG